MTPFKFWRVSVFSILCIKSYYVNHACQITVFCIAQLNHKTCDRNSLIFVYALYSDFSMECITRRKFGILVVKWCQQLLFLLRCLHSVFLHYDANTLNVSVYWLIDCRPIILFSMYSDVMQQLQCYCVRNKCFVDACKV